MYRKAFLDLTEMLRVLYQERNEKLEGESYKLHNEGQGYQDATLMKINQRRVMEEMEKVESRHLHPQVHLHHPLLHLQYINHTSQRTWVKVIF